MATILIVDDVSAHRTSLTAILDGLGHRLIEASNGAEGLAAAGTDPPDLVITDVLMPVMDGLEFVRQLRLEAATARTPVLFYTAPYAEREAKALVLFSGISYVLNKPAEPNEVLAIVTRLLAGEPEPEPAGAGATGGGQRTQLRLLSDRLSEKAEDLRSANARLRALINIGLELASTQDSNQLLQSVCSDARDLFGATYVTLGLTDPTEATVRSLHTCGANADWISPGAAVPGILGAVVAERRTFRGENPSGDPGGFHLPDGHPEVRTLLATAITSASHVYGWICLVGNEGRSFSEDDEDLIVALAGQVGQVYGLEYEIDERRRVEAALRKERDHSQLCLDTAEVILVALDLAGRITLVNRYACTVLGWTEAELMGRDWSETCMPARTRTEFRARFQSLIGGDLATVEHPVLTRAGEELLFEWRNTLLRSDTGEVTGTFSSGADITARTRTTDDLRTAEARTRFALESANVGIWDLDYGTGVQVWSETLEAQYGLAPGTFPGTFEAFTELIHPDDRAGVLETIGKATKSGLDFTVQHRTLWRDGTIRWLRGTGRIMLGERGEPVRALGVSLDITETRQLEEQYQQIQKMEAIGRLAGGVAHDFNNLLTGILGYCELLLADLDPEAPHRADVVEIQRAGLSAAGLTQQLLAFSRKQIIEPALLDLNTIITGLRPMLGRLIGEDVKILLGLRPTLVPVLADRGQVQQILLNLAVNASDAMPGGGTLTIETDEVDLDEDYPATHLGATPGQYVVLTVTDTGTGMPAAVQARLFEPFFTTKPVGKGTGLGLATVHGIVKQNGGSVNVYSELGRGTSFKVYLPRVDAGEAALEEAPAGLSLHRGTETVLLVEDADGLRELTCRLLERQGYAVLVAGDAEEAVRLFDENPAIDVLLTDVVMPGTSGPELTRRLRELRPGLHVVYMSGYTEETIVQHGVLKSGIAFLQKPFTSDSLARKIRSVLDQDTAVPMLPG